MLWWRNGNEGSGVWFAFYFSNFFFQNRKLLQKWIWEHPFLWGDVPKHVLFSKKKKIYFCFSTFCGPNILLVPAGKKLKNLLKTEKIQYIWIPQPQNRGSKSFWFRRKSDFYPSCEGAGGFLRVYSRCTALVAEKYGASRRWHLKGTLTHQ